MVRDNKASLNKYMEKSKEELVRELILLRNKNFLQEQSIAKNERLLEYEKSPDASFEKLESQKKAIEELKVELKASEGDLAISNEELRVQNEELEVTNEELEAQKQEIMKLNEEIAENLRQSESRAEMYLDLMSHDIANMNQIAQGYLELALEKPDLSEEQRELLSTPMEALESSTNLIHTVKRLRLLKEAHISMTRMDVGQVLDAVISKFSKIPGRDISISKKYEQGCEVLANDLLYDVYTNIVGNAIKHSRGPLTINVLLEKVRTMVEGEWREYCRVSVEDNGPGIPDLLKENIFNRFQAGAKNANSRGIGLYLVKSLVDSYKGKIEVEDRVSGDHTQGVRFVVMLPAIEN